MNLSELLSPERVVCDASVASKKRALEKLGELIAGCNGDDASNTDSSNDNSGLDARDIFDSLVSRERLGSTGLGHGVALPHGRLAASDKALGAFIKLSEGVDFDAIDQQPVTLVFALLVPEHFTDEHLKILAYLAEMFSDTAFCQQLHNADSDAGLYALLSNWAPRT